MAKTQTTSFFVFFNNELFPFESIEWCCTMGYVLHLLSVHFSTNVMGLEIFTDFQDKQTMPLHTNTLLRFFQFEKLLKSLPNISTVAEIPIVQIVSSP
jgi:hypothetical protein